MDILSYLLGKQSAGGGGGGGGETYPLTVSTDYTLFVLYDGEGFFADKEPDADLEPSDTRITAAKGDTLYLIAYGEPADVVFLTFVGYAEQQDTRLLEIVPGDFNTATIGEDTIYYAQITIPETDLVGFPWDGEGFIDAFIPVGGGDDPIS